MRWLPLILSCVGFCAGCKQSAPIELPDRLEIEVTGADFEWHIRYAGPDGLIRTGDDVFTKRNLALLVNAPTHISLRSKDYVYNFALPQLDQKEIAVPDLEFSLQFVPIEPGEFALVGDQMCGYQHPKLIGKVRVLGRNDFARFWQNMQSDSVDPSGTN